MGFKLSNLFFVEEEGKKDNIIKDNKKEETVNQTNQNKSENIAKTVSAPKQMGKVDQDVSALAREALLKALESANLEGYDYLEFRNSLKSLETVISDEATRYKSAYAAVLPMGVSGEKLITTAKHYIDILKSEEKKFLYALGLKSDNDVTGSEKRLVQIDEEIRIKAEEIAKLNEEIQKLKNDKNALTGSIDENKRKIENSKNSFYSAYSQVLSGIEDDINKITTHIK